MIENDQADQAAEEHSLPDMQTSDLDRETLESLIKDIEDCTNVLEVIPKYGAESYVADQSNLTLREAYLMLVDRRLRGMQIRYEYHGSQWWDTLMASGESGVRLVRIKHDF